MDYENLKPQDIEDKDIRIKISRKAFRGPIKCHRCKIKMKKVYTDMDIPNGDITVHLVAYKCPRCGRESLNGDQAEKLDYFMSLVDALKNKSRFKFKRAMNFDGHNWFVRFPSELTQNWRKKIETDIIPLTSSNYLIRLARK